MKLSIFIVLAILIAAAAAATTNLNVVSEENVRSAPLPSNGAPVDEVVVESSLYIKPKPKQQLRRTRRAVAPDTISLVEHKRVKRQPKRRQQQQQEPASQEYGQSQAAANAAAQNHYQNEDGFGASAANAQAQAFNAKGPAGSFGASSAGSVTQALNANKFGLQNSAGASMSQTYTLPNGQTINFAGTNSFANGGAGNSANSRGGAVSVSG